jgi:hypothetical protein
VAVHNYSGEQPLAACGAEITVELGGAFKRITCPTSGEGNWWHVAELDADTGKMELVNKIGDEPSGF